MDTLESPILEEPLEESTLWEESFPIKLEDHELDALAFALWREGSRMGWGPPPEADEE